MASGSVDESRSLENTKGEDMVEGRQGGEKEGACGGREEGSGGTQDRSRVSNLIYATHLPMHVNSDQVALSLIKQFVRRVLAPNNLR
jgi:hypothetical protein